MKSLKQTLYRMGLKRPPKPYGLQFERRHSQRPVGAISRRDCIGLNLDAPPRKGELK